MTTMLRRTAIVVAAFACSSAGAQNPIVPQGTGSIAGTVRDRESRQPVEGASVFVQGTNYGTISKANGQYTILGIPAGTYTLVVRHDGLATLEIENIVVRNDVKRPLDVDMSAAGRWYLPTNPPQRVPIVEQGQVGTTAVFCGTGPGAQLGITGLQSASTSFRVDGIRQALSFQSEPVVVDVASWSVFKPGDVVQSVNDEPITTRAGGDAFSNPTVGAQTRAAVRRSGERVELTAVACRAGTVTVTSPGSIPSRGSDTVRIGGGPAGPQMMAMPTQAAAGRGRAGGNAGGRTTTALPSVAAGRAVPGTMTTITSASPDTIMAVPRSSEARVQADIVRGTETQFVTIEGHEFVLRCAPVCRRAIARDGNPYWHFSQPPTIVAAQNSRALRWKGDGLEQGDRVTTVNGYAISSEEAGALLTHASLVLPLQLGLTRNGERKKATVKKQ